MANLLTTLDTILDTRLPIIGLLDKDLLDTEGMKKYYTRKSDKFGYIGIEFFEALYIRRQNNILPLSRPTSICYLLDSFVTDMKEAESSTVILYINTFPYVFSPEQEKEFKKKILTIVPNINDIIMINEYLVDCKWLKNNISLVVDYDGLTAITRYISNGDINRNNLLGITWFIPKMLKDKDDFKDEDFNELISSLSQITNVIDLDIPYFCYVPKK